MTGFERNSLVACGVLVVEVARKRDAVELLAAHASVRVPAVVLHHEGHGLVDVGLGESPRCICARLGVNTVSSVDQGQRGPEDVHLGADLIDAPRHKLRADVSYRVQDGRAQVQVEQHAAVLVPVSWLAEAAGVGRCLVAEDVERHPVGLVHAR